MEFEKCYQEMLDTFPPTMSMEQMRKSCKMSKRMARYLLEQGVIPCKDSGKKTRRFTIQTIDVVKFLAARDICPEEYKAPKGWYRREKESTLSETDTERVKAYYEQVLEPYPEVLSVKHVCEITGYGSTTVICWCVKKHIHRYLIRRKYHIPKESLLEYMLSQRFQRIRVKSEKHRQFIREIEKLLQRK